MPKSVPSKSKRRSNKNSDGNQCSGFEINTEIYKSEQPRADQELEDYNTGECFETQSSFQSSCRNGQARPQTCIGIDLSLTETGLAAICEDGSVVTALVKSNPTTNRLDRFLIIVSQVMKFVDLFTHIKPKDLPIIIEGYAMGSHTGKIFDRAELGGIIRYKLHMLGYTVTDCPPKTLKKFASGNGNADKKAMMKAVKDRWHIDFKNNNLADAYCLAQWGLK